jgi:uncharacterized protein YcfJ
MTIRGQAGAGSATGFILGALGGGFFSAMAADSAGVSSKRQDTAAIAGTVVGAFVGSIIGAVVGAGRAEEQEKPQLEVKFP